MNNPKWLTFAVLFCFLTFEVVLLIGAFNMGHIMGYADGYIAGAGYIARTYELPPRAPCAGIPNCESGD
jgi:hypothetical protein